MDLLDGLLGGPRATGAFVLRCVMEPPWSVRIEDRAPVSLVAVTRGDAWITHDDGSTRHLDGREPGGDLRPGSLRRRR